MRPATRRARDAGRLVAAVEQHLHADADPEERRPSRPRVARDRFEAALAQRAHARAEVADAGQHDRVARADLRGVGREPRVAPRCWSAFSAERRFPMP
jgi:hypothetical protein